MSTLYRVIKTPACFKHTDACIISAANGAYACKWQNQELLKWQHAKWDLLNMMLIRMTTWRGTVEMSGGARLGVGEGEKNWLIGQLLVAGGIAKKI